MPTQPLQNGQYYHIFNRGNNREKLFSEGRNYLYFLNLYSEHILPAALTFAYCLLPNHFHFAIRTRTAAEQEAYRRQEILPFSKDKSLFKLREPSRSFRNLFIAYSRAYNRAAGRRGTLFERPFHRKQIDNQAYFLNLITYIHQNPQRHGLVKDFRDWKWSSYSAFGSDQPSNIQREQVIAWFGGPADFLEAHEKDLADLEDLER